MKIMTMMLIISFVLLLTTLLVSKKTLMNKEKSTSFECGFDPLLMTRTSFSLRFFKIAIIFLIFDIEIIMILPLPMTKELMYNNFMTSSYIIMFIILSGLLFEWQQGSLNWMK